MTTGTLPPLPFLLSAAGLGMTLAGFSGLVAAFRRGGVFKPMDAYRLRQIPEMALAASLVALISGPLADATGGAATAVRIAAALGLAFSAGHAVLLILRARKHQITLPRQTVIVASVINLAILGVAVVCIGTGSPVAYEWFLVLLLVRPILAFALVLGDVAAS